MQNHHSCKTRTACRIHNILSSHSTDSVSIRFSLKAWSTRIERSFVSGFLNRDLRLHLKARSKNKTQDRKDVRDVWTASPADAPRICRESRRTAPWKIKKPARRGCRKMFLCGDLKQRVRGGLARLLRFVKLANHEKKVH